MDAGLDNHDNANDYMLFALFLASHCRSLLEMMMLILRRAMILKDHSWRKRYVLSPSHGRTRWRAYGWRYLDVDMKVWRSCFQNLLHPLRHSFAIFAIKIVEKYSILINMIPLAIVGYVHLIYSTMCANWLKVGINDIQKWTEKVLNQLNFILLFFCIFV